MIKYLYYLANLENLLIATIYRITRMCCSEKNYFGSFEIASKFDGILIVGYRQRLNKMLSCNLFIENCA